MSDLGYVIIPDETVDTVIEAIVCPYCGYPHAQLQHEPGIAMGILYCPKCEEASQ